MTIEDKLKAMMIDNYGSVKHFSEVAQLPYQTVISILNRGILKAGLQNIIDMCKELDLSVDALSEGKLIRNAPVDPDRAKEVNDLYDLVEAYVYYYENFGSCTLDGKPLNDDEMDMFIDGVNIIIDQIRAKRSRVKRGARLSKLDEKYSEKESEEE